MRFPIGRWPFYIAVLLSALLCGCVEYDERIELNADGKTGLYKMHLGVAEQMMGLPEPKDGSLKQIFGLTEADLRKEFDSPGMEVTDIRVNVTTGMRHLYLVCDIKDVSKLTASRALSDRTLLFKRERPDRWSVTQKLALSEKKLTGPDASGPGALKRLEATLGAEKVRKMLSKYTISFSIGAPEGFVASSSQGDVHRGNTVIWKKRLDQLAHSRRSWEMEATFVKAE